MLTNAAGLVDFASDTDIEGENIRTNMAGTGTTMDIAGYTHFKRID